MIATMLIALQSSLPASVEEAKPHVPPRSTHAACPSQDDAGGDIVVCGRVDPNEQYRVRPLTSRYDPVGGPGIGMRVGPGQGNLYAIQQKSPDGKPDKRIMVTLKLPF
jgi:hypothetical protein